MALETVFVGFEDENGNTLGCSSSVMFHGKIVLLYGESLLPLASHLGHMGWLNKVIQASDSHLKSMTFIDEYVKFEVRRKSYIVDEDFSRPGQKMVTAGVISSPLLESVSFSLPEPSDSSKLRSIFVFLRTPGGVIPLSEGDLSDILKELGVSFTYQNVLAEMTPFGNQTFMNTVSRGVVSTVFGPCQSLFLTDACIVQDKIGGAIYAVFNGENEVKRGSLLGIIISPFPSSDTRQYSGFTLCINLLPVFSQLFRCSSRIPQPSIGCLMGSDCGCSTAIDTSNCLNYLLLLEALTKLAGCKWVAALDSAFAYFLPGISLMQTYFVAVENRLNNTVVRVRNGCQTGSGTVLNAASGIIITCSHVITNEKLDIIVFHEGKWYTCDLIFRTADGRAFDLAVLKIKPPHNLKTEMKLSTHSVKEGDIVYAAGYPLLPDLWDLREKVIISAGCVSNFNPFRIQTSCFVNNGHSGGPLIRHGELLGIISANVQSGSTLYHRLNFCIPTSAFIQLINKYITTGDVKYLYELESMDVRVNKMWDSKF